MANRTTEKKTKLTVLVDDETLETIEATAEAENRSFSNVIGTVLKDWSKENPTIKPRKGDVTTDLSNK